MSLKANSGASGSGAGYLKVQRHPRNAVASFGFALVTAATFSAALAVPSIAQAQLTGYKYPAKQVRHTQPQDGWLYTASVPAFNPVVAVAPIEQSQADGYRARAKFRYPLASSGFSTDRSTTESWTVAKFQPSIGERTPAPKMAKPRYDSPLADGWLYIASTPPAFDPTSAIAAIAQSQSERSRAQAKRPRQTDSTAVHDLLGLYAPAWASESLRPQKPSRWRSVELTQDGWLYTAATPAFDPTVAVAPVGQSQLVGYCHPARTARQPLPQDGWLYQASQVADLWNPSKFQNAIGERTATRSASRYRYPLASAGFSTDGSSPAPVDPWTEAKFQNGSWERTAERRKYDPRQELHKFPFGLVDARAVMPSISQLATSERTSPRSQWRPVEQPDQGWVYTSVPPFDPQYLVQISAPTRMGDREKLDVRPGQFYHDMAWLRDVLSLPDPPVIIAEGIYRPVYRPRRRA